MSEPMTRESAVFVLKRVMSEMVNAGREAETKAMLAAIAALKREGEWSNTVNLDSEYWTERDNIAKQKYQRHELEGYLAAYIIKERRVTGTATGA